MKRAARLPRWLGPASACLACGVVIYHRLLFGQLLNGRDLSRLDIPNATFLRAQLLKGELPFWIPYLHLGQPFLAVPETQALYPLRWLALLVSPAAAVTLEHLLSIALLTTGTIWAARCFGASRRAATAATLTLVFGAMMTSLNVEQNMIAALSWTGFVAVAGASMSRRPRSAVAGLAASLALSWLSGAPEITVCQIGIGLGAVLLAAPARARLVSLASTGLGILLGFGLAAPVTLPALRLGQRLPLLSREATLQWSASWLDLLSTVWPAINLPLRDYYGEQHLVPLFFVGALLTACAAIGLTRSHRLEWALGGSIAVLCLLSLGKTLGAAAWVLTHAPVLRSFRYPSKYLVVAEWLLTLAAARGIDRFAALVAAPERRRRFLAVAGVGLAALAIAGAVALPHLRAGAKPGLAIVVFWLALPLVLLAVVPRAAKLSPLVIGRTLSVLAVLEALTLTASPQSADRQEIASDGSLVLAMKSQGWARASIQEPISPDELLVVSPAVARQALGGRCALFLHNRFVEVGLSSLDAEGPMDDGRLGATWAQLKQSAAFRDLAGVGWLVALPAPPETSVPWASCDQAPEGLRLSISRMLTAMPRAFLLHEVTPTAEVPDAVQWLTDATEPFRRSALMQTRPALGTCDGHEAVTVSKDEPNALAFEVDACAAGVLVVNEANDPGWRATLDGRDAPVLTADLFLQAVAVPTGKHRLVLRYDPASFRWGLWVALASALVLIGIGVASSANSAASQAA